MNYLVSALLVDPSLFGFRPSGSQNLLQLVFLKEIWHLARVQHVVYVLQELFHHNLQHKRVKDCCNVFSFKGFFLVDYMEKLHECAKMLKEGLNYYLDATLLISMASNYHKK